MLTFFGLTPEYKKELHRTIFALVNRGAGWDWQSLYYHIPVYLRNFYISELLKVEKLKTTPPEYNKNKKGTQVQIPDFARKVHPHSR